MPAPVMHRVYSAERVGQPRQGDRGAAAGAGVLEAIQALRDDLQPLIDGTGDARSLSMDEETEAVQIEIARMVRTISQAKAEIASIRHPLSEENRISSASGQLDAIVAATETATQNILGASEQIEAAINKLGALYAEDEDAGDIIGDIAQQVVFILEACNFQDITGQRISRVVKTIRYIEERVIRMIEIWGTDQFTGIPVPGAEAGQDDDARLLNGPQMAGEGLQQSEIDALFD